MADEWFYVADKKKMGPVSFANLRDMVAHGKINRADMLLQGGTAKWLAAETVQGLFPAAPSDLPLPYGLEEVHEPPPDLAVFEDATAVRIRPHQGDLILGLGIGSIATSVIGLFSPCFPPLAAFALIGMGLGVPAWMKASGDLRKMRSGLVDPAGESSTRTGQICAIVGSVIGAIGILLMVAALFVYIILKYFMAPAGNN